MRQIFTLLMVIVTLTSQAQIGKARISGTVIDGSQKTIESASILLTGESFLMLDNLVY